MILNVTRLNRKCGAKMSLEYYSWPKLLIKTISPNSLKSSVSAHFYNAIGWVADNKP